MALAIVMFALLFLSGAGLLRLMSRSENQNLGAVLPTAVAFAFLYAGGIGLVVSVAVGLLR